MIKIDKELSQKYIKNGNLQLEELQKAYACVNLKAVSVGNGVNVYCIALSEDLLSDTREVYLAG